MAEWDAVVVAGARFGTGPPLGDFQLARALAATRRVLYVDPPLFPHRLASSGQVLPRASLRREGEHLHVLTPVAPPFADRRVGRAAGDHLIGRQIRRAASEVLGDDRVIVSFDPRRGLLPEVDRGAFVYWIRDRLGSSPQLRHRAEFVERHHTVIREADIVTAVSAALVEHISTLTGRAPALVMNGCDYSHFSQPVGTRPARFDGPVIGYSGGVSWRLDVDLVAEIADRRPEWNLVLVGEVTTTVPERPNLHVVGRKQYAELPGWLSTFDVGLIPYAQIPFNESSDPLKALEYLARGLPVVSTPIPALEALGPLVSVASNTEDMVAAVDGALADHDPRPGREFAAANDWRRRADTLVSIVEAEAVGLA